jgi:hypothetical protein
MVHGATKSKKISDMAKNFLLTTAGQRQLKTSQSMPGSDLNLAQSQSWCLRKKIPCTYRRKMASTGGEMQTSSFRK